AAARPLPWKTLASGRLHPLILLHPSPYRPFLPASRTCQSAFLTFPQLFFPRPRITALIPFACIEAAIFIISISKRIVRFFELSSSERGIIAVLAILVLFQSAYKIVQFDGLLVKRDNRVIVADWINENLREKSSICQIGGTEEGSNLRFPPSVAYLEQEQK